MSVDDLSSAKLPPGMSKKEALAIARKFAPLLLFHRNESHLSEDPDNFRKAARFRESNFSGWRDRGYHKRLGWQETNEYDTDYFNISWEVIKKECQERFGSEVLDPAHSLNLRPQDSENLHGDGSNKGLFLDLTDDVRKKQKSGIPVANNLVTAPVFIDFAYDQTRSIVKVLYWFFYALNKWMFIITHEGDWEHITVFFREDRFKNGDSPSWVYFAQHNGGIPIHFSKLQKEGDVDEIHAVVYVDRNGHASDPRIRNPEKYSIRWETWKSTMSMVADCDWKDFAGAWGEVGESSTFTGPLGPMFKRHKDDVIIVKSQKRFYVKVPKTWRF